MNEVVKIKDEPRAITPMEMLNRAVEQGADLDKLTKLMDLQDRYEANLARKAYIDAMTSFKQNPPDIKKDKTVRFETGGGRTEYTHASLHHVTQAVTKALSQHDLTHAWTVEQLDGGIIRVTCSITHVGGHSESVSMQSGADQSGKKNNIQAIGSTVTYLERYTLLALTGLSAADMDDDGGKSEKEPITEDQLIQLRDLLDETKSDVPKFCKYIGIDGLPSITQSKFKDAIAALEKKKGDK